MGGKSIEREVSFNSGRTICDHLDTHRYTIIPVFQTETGSLCILPQHFLHRGKISDFAHRLEKEAERITWDQLKKLVDFVYITVHGRYAEDGTIQGILEVLGIPYLGAKVFGSALGMDKSAQKIVLSAGGIDVPRGFTLSPEQIQSLSADNLSQLLEQNNIELPCVVKPTHEGSSYGVSIAENLTQTINAIHAASTVDKRRTQHVIVEEKLAGMEFVCVSLEKVQRTSNSLKRSWFSFPITEVVLEADKALFDYEQKYMPGRALKITPARCSEHDRARIIEACEKAAQLLNFSTISRIDGFLTTDGRVVLIDPNSLTGMSPSTFLFNQAAEYGMSHTKLINFLIENELKSYGLIDDTTWSENEEGSDMTSVPHKKLRVAVLLGGDSNEREVSLESGRNVCYKLSPQKYDVLPLFVNDAMELFLIPQNLLIKNTTRTIALSVTAEMQVQWSDLPSICDFVFIGLHGGRGENGAVQGTLEMLDMPYNGPGVLASALCIDKFKTNNYLRAQGFDVPKSILLNKDSWLGLLPEDKTKYLEDILTTNDLTLPIIAKPHDDGCSVMVKKAKTIADLQTALDSYFSTPKQAVLLEELIIGTELTVGVLGNQDVVALPPSMAVSQAGILSMEEKFLPGAGENQTPAPLPSHILDLVKETVARAFKAIGCEGYSRVDCFYQTPEQSPTKKDRIVLLEFNTVPALTPATCLFHQAAELGIKPMDFIDKIVDLGLERHHRTHRDHSVTASTKTVLDYYDETEEPKKNKQNTELVAQKKTDESDLVMKLF